MEFNGSSKPNNPKFLFFVMITALLHLFHFTTLCETANIVFLHNIGSYSHRVVFQPLAEKLADRGHNIVYISVYKPPVPYPNITDLQPLRFKTYYEATLDADFDVTSRIRRETPATLVFEELSITTCKELLLSQEFQFWLRQAPKVDLIFADIFPECGYGIAYKLKNLTSIQPKVVLISASSQVPRNFDYFGIPDESSSIPLIDSDVKVPMTFLSRVKNSFVSLVWYFYMKYYTLDLMEETLKEHLELQDLPPMEEFQKNLSLVLCNGNFIHDFPRALPPNFISVSGMHVKDKHDSLPKEIEDFLNSLDESQEPCEGFVYISLGTIVQSQYLPENFKSMFFNAVKAFPKIRFLWKWGGEKPKNAPKNLYLSNFFPQQDLFGHAKIRGFITQAGRPSTQEAVYNGVPMITFPVLGDQTFNAERLEYIGVSINIEMGDLTDELLQNSLSSILYETSYKEKVNHYARIFRDMPMRPIDTAVWWTEYALRHDDLSHLQSLGRHQTWYQRRLIDVYLLIFLVTTSTFYFVLLICRRICFRRNYFSTRVIKESSRPNIKAKAL